MSVGHEASILAGRNLRRFVRSPRLLGDAVTFPLVLLLLLLVMFGEVVGGATDEPYIARLAPGIVLFSVAYSCVGTAVGFHADVHGGFQGRLRTMPIARMSPLLGRIAGDVVKFVLVTVVTVAVGYLLGFRFEQGFPAAVGFLLVVLLFALIFLWSALVVALTARSAEAAASSLNAPVTLLLLVSTCLVPLSAFPGWAQPAIRANPLSCAHAALVGLSSGGPVLVPVLQTLAWVLGATLLLGPLALRLARR
ncbi:ABC transporter permease [Micromonospora sp. WMMD998]|uniref:ABC transporter permease n=1 Tax=Micromonospora sp. WMMD998 TaxID=3016092 RepID=UPI002499F973|nr:ABC transporter permease [Micromonospora sp. WMMD998]WFE37413.1 ABC transporter permease [Micromonospora sp. WMMD998]